VSARISEKMKYRNQASECNERTYQLKRIRLPLWRPGSRRKMWVYKC